MQSPNLTVLHQLTNGDEVVYPAIMVRWETGFTGGPYKGQGGLEIYTDPNVCQYVLIKGEPHFGTAFVMNAAGKTVTKYDLS